MADRMRFEAERSRLFAALLEAPWQGRKVWEHIRDKEDDHALCATPAFEGELFHAAGTKIMFVGRDLNGWTEMIGDCSTLENAVHSVTQQDGTYALDTIVNRKGVPQDNGRRTCFHRNSKFLRFIKHVLEYCGESTPGIDDTWYEDPLHWNQRIVWANLFCIAPRNPDPEKGVPMHASPRLQRPGIQHYVDLMDLYIAHYRPDAVVFITGLDWFVPWKRKAAFRDIVDNYCEDPAQDVIVATGTVGSSHIIVCRRPDRRGMTHQQVQDMARVVAEYIQAKVHT